MRRLIALLLTLVIIQPAHAQNRHALVVGIDAYAHVEPLQKAVNDARAMAAALEQVGFQVTALLDPDHRDMIQSLSRFAAMLSPGDEALFYFAGHGIEVDGQNYLLPADIPEARPGDEYFLIEAAIGVDRALASLQRQGVRVSLLILDACRNNPFPRQGTRSLGGSRGLARVDPPQGSYVIYSAGAGQKALDRLGDDDHNPNSIFTRALLPRLTQPGLDLRSMVQQVRSEVRRTAMSVGHDQFPAVYDQLDGSFMFDVSMPIVTQPSDAPPNLVQIPVPSEHESEPVRKPEPELPPRQRDASDIYEDLSTHTIYTNGTYFDKATGLQWLQCPLGQSWTAGNCLGVYKVDTLKNWQRAVTQLNSTGSIGGYTDWRMPTLLELRQARERNAQLSQPLRLWPYQDPVSNDIEVLTEAAGTVAKAQIGTAFGMRLTESENALRLVRSPIVQDEVCQDC